MPLVMKPTSVIEARLGIQPNGPAHAYFTERCYAHMDKYVPRREGRLRREVDVQTDKIVYEQPYARYQYYGVRQDGTRPVRHYTTPGTGPYWDKRMVSAELNDIVKEVQDKFGGK